MPGTNALAYFGLFFSDEGKKCFIRLSPGEPGRSLGPVGRKVGCVCASGENGDGDDGKKLKKKNAAFLRHF